MRPSGRTTSALPPVVRCLCAQRAQHVVQKLQKVHNMQLNCAFNAGNAGHVQAWDCLSTTPAHYGQLCTVYALVVRINAKLMQNAKCKNAHLMHPNNFLKIFWASWTPKKLV